MLVNLVRKHATQVYRIGNEWRQSRARASLAKNVIVRGMRGNLLRGATRRRSISHNGKMSQRDVRVQEVCGLSGNAYVLETLYLCLT